MTRRTCLWVGLNLFLAGLNLRVGSPIGLAISAINFTVAAVVYWLGSPGESANG